MKKTVFASLNKLLNDMILAVTGALSVERGEVIQSLWSGYGEIVRVHLQGADVDSVVVKHVVFPSQVNHPRGWHNDHSHQRKVTSYEVEMAWYADWADRCDEHCRVPKCLVSETINDDHLMVLEDLDAVGFPVRKSWLDKSDVQLCLKWLANFHATFMGEKPKDLWPTGTYWYLATRPDELAVMQDDSLREAAPVIDSMLSNAKFKTLVHGDAKVANFCFSDDGESVAAVDFQYVGGGCGMKDVAYFMGSCLDDQQQQDGEAAYLDYYFDVLRSVVDVNIDGEGLEAEWRALFPIAQTDFYRFLVGWMPTHWKVNDYNKRVALRVVSGLDR
ncbi:MAG: phosphotransferase [Mariprofundaceae bacterium]